MSTTPSALRKQMQVYERAGFTAVRVDPTKKGHFKASFVGIAQTVVLTPHANGDPRAIHNNLALLRRLSKGPT